MLSRNPPIDKITIKTVSTIKDGASTTVQEPTKSFDD